MRRMEQIRLAGNIVEKLMEEYDCTAEDIGQIAADMCRHAEKKPKYDAACVLAADVVDLEMARFDWGAQQN
ncbi:MAG: hypothetical protein ACLFTT_02515 [Candidatus Hydrogenedentota bacterium]